MQEASQLSLPFHMKCAPLYLFSVMFDKPDQPGFDIDLLAFRPEIHCENGPDFYQSSTKSDRILVEKKCETIQRYFDDDFWSKF